jgi:UPF0271 protein
MLSIDFNADLGEGAEGEEALMPFISSSNIACGFHAGDPQTMRRAVRLALEYGVSPGAHPGFPDREHFGRRNMVMDPFEIHGMITTQLQELSRIAGEESARLIHVKPHGALYNMAARDRALADAICIAVRDFDENLVVFGLSGSEIIRSARDLGLKTRSEVFADRNYQDDGTLTPRNLPHALVEDPGLACARVLKMIREGTVRSLGGKEVPVQAETLCVHGDGANALRLATAIQRILTENQIQVSSVPGTE